MPTIITKALCLAMYLNTAALRTVTVKYNGLYSTSLYSYQANYIVSMMYVNAKATPINHIDYSCYITAVELD